MADPTPARCITCGQEAVSTTRLNALPSGEPCPACAERLLDTLAPALPSQAPRRAAARERQPGPAAPRFTVLPGSTAAAPKRPA
jgi:hypothetical protein